MDEGTSGSGGSFLSPFFVFLLLVALQTLDGFLDLVKRAQGWMRAPPAVAAASSPLSLSSSSSSLCKPSMASSILSKGSFNRRFLSLRVINAERLRSSEAWSPTIKKSCLQDGFDTGTHTFKFTYFSTFGKGMRSPEEIQLRKEIKQLLKEAGSLSTPSTFAQSAKLRRMAAAKEKELLKKQEEHRKEKNSSYELCEKALLGFKVLLYSSLVLRFWGVPVAVVPQHLLQPFGKVLSWRAGDAAAGQIMVGIIPWLILTSRVGKFLWQKLSRSFFNF